ncbi:YwhD family protein [Bacillus sp. FSL K6-3431]|uniref:YwhD family protein n=1 Tax=Bacillus sp. FSL K6-3431 TaxID=2921500 RepID=UPI0030FC78B9
MKESSPSGPQFNILKNDPTRGEGGYGVGTISLENITPVIIDPEETLAFIDIDALHGRSCVERKVRFGPTKDNLIEPRLYWIVWVSLELGDIGPFYSGIGACEILISREERRIRPGYKSMPEHVNTLDQVLKNKILISHMDAKSKELLKRFLIKFNYSYWEHSNEEVKKSFS